MNKERSEAEMLDHHEEYVKSLDSKDFLRSFELKLERGFPGIEGFVSRDGHKIKIKSKAGLGKMEDMQHIESRILAMILSDFYEVTE